MSTFCGQNDGWHDERGFGDGHYRRDSMTWCSGRAPEPDLYTMEQAVILGRRALCESSDRGHDIGRTDGIVIKNANGTIQQWGYGCANCDVKIEVSYPPLLPARRGA